MPGKKGSKMKIYDQTELDFKDVLVKPKRSFINSRSEVEVTREYKFKWCPRRIVGTGIISANMATVGTFQVAKHMMQNKMFCCLHKHYEIDDLIKFITENDCRNYVFLSMGLRDEDYKKIETILTEYPDKCRNICIDVPNAYIPRVKELVIKMREKFPDILLMVGNAVTAELVEDLILSGADIVKCGIGSGSACITRRITGVGRPQLSTIFECADTAHGIGGMICSDGGVVYVGDICKAFGAGADFVMMGGFYAGCPEAAGDIIEKKFITGQIDEKTGERVIETKRFKVFYGMSSEYAQNKHYHGMPKYRASEGRVVEVPLRDPIDKMNQDILGGLRSYMTYIGARRLKDVSKCTTFYRVNTQLNTVFGE